MFPDVLKALPDVAACKDPSCILAADPAPVIERHGCKKAGDRLLGLAAHGRIGGEERANAARERVREPRGRFGLVARATFGDRSPECSPA